ncbi:tyrosine kinase receptor Cad96Ca [Coccinella septempunctata]|uniref:tyrosine kinase receptor Cad96Ca n=1 Tax=Coccinella septempunctata TaxID=41139 RepID=UPI001D084054|nr:tyrosine kinase receptor Cad96Ca [Coccinella septempunctata]
MKFLLLSLTWILVQVRGQIENTPPTVYLERNWKIYDTEPVGTRIAEAHGSDLDGDTLSYGITPIVYDETLPVKNLPFVINETTGVVYLNESLKGRAGEDIHLWVTVFDGTLEAKAEVYVNILSSSSPSQKRKNNFGGGGNGRPPSFPSLPNFPPHFQGSIINPPPSISNNPRPLPKHPYFQKTTYTQPKPSLKRPGSGGDSNNSKTYLRPITSSTTTSSSTTTTTTRTTSYPTGVRKKVELEGVELSNDVETKGKAVKTVPDVKMNIIPVLAVCGVFLVVAFTAVLFRRRLNLGKSDEKDDMRKDSSGGTIVLQEDPGHAMQNWRGPRAFSNRYEPWDRDTNHNQTSEQLSTPINKPDRWEFPRHRLKFFNILGEGAFGQVWKCEAIDLDDKEKVSVVAVKTLKENANEKERSDLASELQVMKMLEPHPNVIRLLGCCTDKEPILLIMEYVSRGKLQSYLRNSRAERYYNNMHGQSKSLTSRDLTSFLYQVAKGMDYLSANGIIHRDLAARNVLITEDQVCKVADFGFARDVIASHVYERKSEGRLPIRWMAPESLYDNIFSVKSDVWSFGILMWEVVTLGSTPYPGMSASDVMKKVRDGYRLDKPEHCRRELYNIMYYCWDKDPKQRPNFGECVGLLEKLLMTETDYIELERFPDHSYYNMVSLSGEKL